MGTSRSILVVLLFVCHVSMGQVLECPIKGGHFKEFGLYAHHDPAESAVIVSDNLDSVQSVSDGRIFKILDHNGNNYSVIVMTSDSIVLAYRFFSTVLFEEGESIKQGKTIGLVDKNDQGRYEIGVSYRKRSGPVNPRLLLKCKK